MTSKPETVEEEFKDFDVLCNHCHCLYTNVKICPNCKKVSPYDRVETTRENALSAVKRARKEARIETMDKFGIIHGEAAEKLMDSIKNPKPLTEQARKFLAESTAVYRYLSGKDTKVSEAVEKRTKEIFGRLEEIDRMYGASNGLRSFGMENEEYLKVRTYFLSATKAKWLIKVKK